MTRLIMLHVFHDGKGETSKIVWGVRVQHGSWTNMRYWCRVHVSQCRQGKKGRYYEVYGSDTEVGFRNILCYFNPWDARICSNTTRHNSSLSASEYACTLVAQVRGRGKSMITSSIVFTIILCLFSHQRILLAHAIWKTLVKRYIGITGKERLIKSE